MQQRVYSSIVSPLIEERNNRVQLRQAHESTTGDAGKLAGHKTLDDEYNQGE
jgi:hypothetical protein